MNGGHQEMLWGVLRMIHMWETYLPRQYWTISARGGGEEKHHAKTTRSQAENKQKEVFPPGWVMDRRTSLPRGITGVKSLPRVPGKLDKYLEEQSSGTDK